MVDDGKFKAVAEKSPPGLIQILYLCIVYVGTYFCGLQNQVSHQAQSQRHGSGWIRTSIVENSFSSSWKPFSSIETQGYRAQWGMRQFCCCHRLNTSWQTLENAVSKTDQKMTPFLNGYPRGWWSCPVGDLADQLLGLLEKSPVSRQQQVLDPGDEELVSHVVSTKEWVMLIQGWGWLQCVSFSRHQVSSSPVSNCCVLMASSCIFL